jgi:hypothetical protein
MPLDESELAKLVSDTARETAARQGAAISEYGGLVTKYGKGQIDLSEVSRAGTKLFVRESYALMEDWLKASSAYWQYIAELLGTAVPAAKMTPATKASKT